MKKITSFILILFYLQVSMAQKSIQTAVSKSTVTTNETFQFQIVINNADCEVATPSFDGLLVISGPNQSQYTSTEIINGSYSKTTEYSWTYVLRAKKEGDYTIPGVSMVCDKRTYTSEPIKIIVTKNSDSENIDQDYYMLLTSNKKSVFVGEPFITTLTYYSKKKPASFDGLEIGIAQGVSRYNLNPDRKTFQTNTKLIKGVQYYVVVLYEEVCLAQQSGTITLEPIYAALGFQSGNFNRYRKETYSNKIEIDVKKIPTNNATDFNGLVGDFSIASDLSHKQVLMGEAIDLRLTISGTGNMEAIGIIELDIPKEFNQFDPDIIDNLNISKKGVEGQIDFNFVLVPTVAGEYTIPAYSFSYFDLGSKRMKSLKTDDFIIKVDKRETTDLIPPHSVESKKKDLKYIEEKGDAFFEQEALIFGSWTYYLLFLSPLFLAFIFIFFNRKKENLSEDDILKTEQKKAVKIAVTSLKEMYLKADNGEDNVALKGTQSIINTFFQQKFNIGLSDLSQGKIEQQLIDKNIDLPLREKFNKVWKTIEMGQYAPIPHDNLLKTITETEELLIALDKQL